MPNSASAKKSLRQNHRRRDRNRTQRSMLRTLVKKCREAAEAGDPGAADEAYRVAAKRLDQAAAKRMIHPNKAARTKSRLSKLVKAVKGTPSATPPSSDSVPPPSDSAPPNEE